MTAPSPQPFSFETSYDLEAMADRKRARVGVRPFGATADQLYIIVAAVGGILMFWRYTLALGIVVFLCAAFAWSLREKSRERIKNNPHLRPLTGRVRVGLTETGFWMRGDGFFTEGSWRYLFAGFEDDGYVVLHSRHALQLYLPIEELKSAGVYDPVHAIIEACNAKHRKKPDPSLRSG